MRIFRLFCLSMLLSCSENYSPSSQTQIVGGDEANIEDYPFFVALFVEMPTGTKHFCSGSQIEPGAILTAAHCIQGLGKDAQVHAAFLVQDFANMEHEPNVVYAQITDMIKHNRYLPSNYSTPDIALMFYDKKSVPYEVAQAKISLADLGLEQAAANQYATVIGHGSGSVFKRASLPPVELKICRAIPKYAYDRLNENFLCYGDMEKDADAPCRGDSGGPLIFNQKGKDPVLLGVTNWGGEPCGLAAEPTVYTRVSVFRDWIATRIYLFN